MLLLQYSACLPERHGLFLRLRLLRGRRSAAGPARWPRRRRPTPPAASRLGPARLALPGLSSPLPAPLASPWSAAGLPSPLAAACPLSRCLTGTLSLLSFCSPSFICRAPGLYCLSASLSLSLSLSLSPPTQRGAPRTGGSGALSLALPRRLRARCALQRRRAGLRWLGRANGRLGGALGSPAIAPSFSRLTPPRHTRRPRTARRDRGEELPGRAVCLVCGTPVYVCVSVCACGFPHAGPSSRIASPTPPHQPIPSQERRQSPQAVLIRRRLVSLL